MTDRTDAADDDARYAQVPPDFPRPAHYGAVPGLQPKLLVTQYKGRFYMPGCTPPEIVLRWDVCEDLARQLSAKSVESKAGKRRHMSELEILGQYLSRLIATRWTSEEEARWVIRRAATMLGWPIPPEAEEPTVPDWGVSPED
jgi:hypothetical protein